jgi:hypothetical protein
MIFLPSLKGMYNIFSLEKLYVLLPHNSACVYLCVCVDGWMVVSGGSLHCNMMLPLHFMRLMRRRAFNCSEKYMKMRGGSVMFQEVRFIARGPIKCFGVTNWMDKLKGKWGYDLRNFCLNFISEVFLYVI